MLDYRRVTVPCDLRGCTLEQCPLCIRLRATELVPGSHAPTAASPATDLTVGEARLILGIMLLSIPTPTTLTDDNIFSTSEGDVLYTCVRPNVLSFDEGL